MDPGLPGGLLCHVRRDAAEMGEWVGCNGWEQPEDFELMRKIGTMTVKEVGLGYTLPCLSPTPHTPWFYSVWLTNTRSGTCPA